MKKRTRFLVNALLVVVSLVIAFQIMRLADMVTGALIGGPRWPGMQGLLFNPNTEDHWAMHDYHCTEIINSLGFRDNEVPVKKAHAYRIVAIGDSFTYGWGVNLENTWVKRLEFYLRQQGLDVEVLDLGKPAAGPNEYADMARTVIPVLKPDMVILGILNGDDLQQAQSDTEHPVRLLMSYFPNFQRLVINWKNAKLLSGSPPRLTVRTEEECRKIEIKNAQEQISHFDAAQRERFDKLEQAVKDAFFAGTLNPWLIGHSTGWPDYFMNTTSLDELKSRTRWMGRQFCKIKKTADPWGASVLALSLPEGFYVNKEAYRNVQRIGFHVVPEMLTTDVPDQAIEQACRTAGFPFVSVLADFRKHADEPGLYFELDRHMAPAGHELFAKTVAPIVARYMAHTPRK